MDIISKIILENVIIIFFVKEQPIYISVLWKKRGLIVFQPRKVNDVIFFS